jgi:hypothetical protein
VRQRHLLLKSGASSQPQKQMACLMACVGTKGGHFLAQAIPQALPINADQRAAATTPIGARVSGAATATRTARAAFGR